MLKPIQSKVLIVDDDRATALLFKEILWDLDIDILIANSGEEALKLVQGKRFALFLLDLQMPIMNGYELQARLKKTPGLETTPTIFISADYADTDKILEGINSGAIDYIPKPVNHAILIAKVEQLVLLDQYRLESERLISKLEDSTIRAKENEERFKKISYAANDSIIVLDENFNVRFWNRASKNIFGYNKIEIRDENIFKFIIATKEINRLKKKLTDVINSSTNILQETEEIMALNKVGYEFPVEMSFSSFKTRDNKHNIVVVTRDITIRKKLELNVLRAKELREANKTMKEFIDNISHELRTPMNAIIGISKMLGKYNIDNLTNKQIEGLNIIHNNGEKLLDLINDLLDVSRLESGKLKLNEDVFSLEKVISNIRSVIVNLIGNKPIKFIVKKSPGVPDEIFSDQKKLSQILTNLLGNSVKFTEQGKIALSIHLQDNLLHFEVYDTGCGIPSDQLGKVFGRFSQADASNSKVYQGSGLGLHIVKKMVGIFNGKISVDSELNKSTTFKFHIPLSKIIHNEIPNIPVAEQRVGIDYKSRKLLALIIEDSPVLVDLYKNYLNRLDYDILISNNGLNGNNLLLTYKPNLLILNIEIGKYSSFSIIKNIQNIADFSEVAIILTSSKVDNLTFKLPSNKSEFLPEPITEIKLIEKIRSVNPTRHKMHPFLIMFKETNKPDCVKIKDIDKPYSFINNFVDEAYFIYSRRKSPIIILQDLRKNSNNYKLLLRLNKFYEQQFNKPHIIICGTNKELTQDIQSIHVTHVNKTFFENEVTVNQIKELVKIK